MKCTHAPGRPKSPGCGRGRRGVGSAADDDDAGHPEVVVDLADGDLLGIVEDGFEGRAVDDAQGVLGEAGHHDAGHPGADELAADLDAELGRDAELDLVAEQLELEQGLGLGRSLADHDLLLDAAERVDDIVGDEVDRLAEDEVEPLLGLGRGDDRTGDDQLGADLAEAERDGCGSFHGVSSWLMGCVASLVHFMIAPVRLTRHNMSSEPIWYIVKYCSIR